MEPASPFVCCNKIGVPADDSRIQGGIAWLKANQQAGGRWFTRSQ
jgi:squalene-hopene/tetraprenyl-beta-curcumene cyclase